MNTKVLIKLSYYSIITSSILYLTSEEVIARSYSLSQTFTMPDVTEGDLFGSSVALDGNNVLIGAAGNDSDGRSAGRAYLFDGLTGNLSQTFTMPDVTNEDRFGLSVALDGNNVLIGAPSNKSDGRSVGRAYLFDGLTGNLSQTFTMPDVTNEDRFGLSVALDGNNVLIGAFGNDSDGLFVGRAYLFDGLTGNLSQTFTMPDVTERDLFGFSVALDGNNVLIGANGNDSDGRDVGRAYLFDGLTGNLSQTFTMPDVTERDGFGNSVALDGNNVLIGANENDSEGRGVGRAYLFDGLTGNLSQTFTMPDVTESDDFGSSVALDGNNVLIGAHLNDSEGNGVGRAYLFNGLTGNLSQTFTMPDVTFFGISDDFGGSVALDGNNVLIGALGNNSDGLDVGRAYLFSIESVEPRESIPEPSSVLGIGFFLGLGLITNKKSKHNSIQR